MTSRTDRARGALRLAQSRAAGSAKPMRWGYRIAAGMAAAGAAAVLGGFSALAFAEEAPAAPAPAASAPTPDVVRAAVVGVPDMVWPDVSVAPVAEPAPAWRWVTWSTASAAVR